MTLPVAKILWAGNDPGPHGDHLHVEGIPRYIGYSTGTGAQPPPTNPGLTDSVWSIFIALSEKFGSTAYFLDDDADEADWTHMGWYNRRTIGGKTQWSQHAWANALDIGPYYGVEEQQKFYDFLTGKEDTMEKITRPSWVSDKMLSDLAAQNIVPRERETEDMWRFLTFLHRHISAGGDASGLQRGDTVKLV